jgi:hypothetical protein
MWWINSVARKSPDLIPTEFLLWAHVKDRVYVPPIPELKKGIGRAVESISIQVLQDLWMELQCRLNVCKYTSDAYIEVYAVKETLTVVVCMNTWMLYPPDCFAMYTYFRNAKDHLYSPLLLITGPIKICQLHSLVKIN